MKKITVSAFIVSLLFCGGLYSDGKNKQKTSSGTEKVRKTYSFSEEGMERTIVLEPELLAEFGSGSIGKAHSRSVEPREFRGGAKIWNISGSSLSRDLSQGRTAVGAELSPVYSENGRLMAFPGGILVQLKAGKNCQNWASGKSLKLGEQSAVPSICQIPTASGNAALDLANSLKNDPDVKSAVPNLWMESSHR